MKIQALFLSMLLGMGLTATLLQADDTEIYLNNGNNNVPGPPLVMFSLDFRSNLTSTYAGCANINSPDHVGDTYCETAQYFYDELVANDPGFTFASVDIDVTGPLYFFDALRLALKIVLDNVKDVKLGLMMNHGDNTTGQCKGVGPDFGQDRTPVNKRCSNGGFIAMGFELLGEPGVDDTARDNFNNKLQAFKRQKMATYCGKASDSSCPDHIYQGVELFFEFYRYLIGKDLHNGHNGWDDFESGGTIDHTDMMRCAEADAITKLACWDPAILTPTDAAAPTTTDSNNYDYISPLGPLGDCGKIYTINLYFGNSQDGKDSKDEINAPVAQGGIELNGEELPSSDTQKFGYLVDYLHNADLADPDYGTPDLNGKQNVTSYFIYDGNNQNEVNDLARKGGTNAAILLTQDPADLIDTIQGIFDEILSVSTTFVSASLPIDAANSAAILDELYFALFQVYNQPNWVGNIKRFKKADDLIVDVNGVNAIAADNRIKFDALSFWTDSTGGDVQDADAGEGEQVGNDGRSVHRGGVGQKMPGYMPNYADGSGSPGDVNAVGTRKVLIEPETFTNGTPTALVPFNTSSSDTTLAAELRDELGVLGTNDTYDFDGDTDTDDIDYALRVMRWLRGQDSFDADGNGDDITYPTNKANDPGYTETRHIKLGSNQKIKPWWVGDILHSRPLVINYGARGTGFATNNQQDVRILAGTNHGVFHMFQNIDDTGTPIGTESWAFVARETLGIAKTVGLGAGAGPDHPYGIDGPATAIIQDNGDGKIEGADMGGTDKVWTYFGLRRGGKAYYSLDLSNPDDPKILWKIDETGTDTGEMGMTFSRPEYGQVDYGTGSPVKAIFVGGGYDAKKDGERTLGTDDSEGNAVYILNAETGAVIWKAVFDATPATPTATRFEHAQMKDSIPMVLGLVDLDRDGIIERFYFADTGGRVWRADTPLPSANTTVTDIRTKWAVTLIGDLGRHVNATEPNDRRFFHGVNVSEIPGSPGAYNIVVGSGDRPDPLGLTDENKIFVLKDDKVFNAQTTGALPGEVTDPSGHFPLILDTDAGTTGKLDNVTDNCLQQDPTCGGSPPSLTHGWYINLEETGEKMLSRPRIFNNIVLYTTFLPAAGAVDGCLPEEGGGRLYAVRMDNGGAAFDNDPSSCTNPDGLCKEDRVFLDFDELPPGIPSDPVVLPGGEVVVGTKILKLQDTGILKTFWYQKEDEGTPN